MQKSAINELRTLMLDELTLLDQEDTASIEDRATVTLDQQSVGRLSRMDALQRQALAQATQRRRDVRRTRLKAALTRMDEDEFGFCEDCGDEIAFARLKLDPTVTVCIDCASER